MTPDANPASRLSANPLGAARVLLRRARSDSLVRNSLFIMGTTVTNSAIGYVFWILVARTCSTRQVGLGAALIAAMSLVAMLSNVGSSYTLIQVLPTRPTGRDWSRTFNACMAAALCASVLGACISLAVLPRLSPQFLVVREAAYQIVIIGGVAFWTASTLFDSVFVAERRAGNMLARNATAATAKLGLMLGLIALGVTTSFGIVNVWMVSTAGSLVVAAVVLLPRLHRGYRLQVRGIASEARRLLPPFIGHYFVTVGGLVSVTLVPIVVTSRLSATSNAYFYTTWMLCSVFFMISPAIAASLFAEASHEEGSLHAKSRSAFLLSTALLGLPAMMLLFGGRFVLGLFGPEYARHSYTLLVLLLVSSVPDAITNIYIIVLRVEKRFHAAAALNIGMGLGTVVLTWLALPRVGITGAGIAWLAMQTAGTGFVAVDLHLRRTRPALWTRRA